MLANVAPQLRFADPVLLKEGFKARLVETARHACKDRQVGDTAVDEPLADAETEFVGELFEGRTPDQLIQRLVETARFDEGGHRQPRLLLPRVVIRKAHAVAQLADADVGVADAGDIGAADTAEARAARDVAERESDPDEHDKGEREKLADRGGEEVADGGNHEASGLSAKRDAHRCGCFRGATGLHQGAKAGFGRWAIDRLPMRPRRR